jgi:hypothetical protein
MGQLLLGVALALSQLAQMLAINLADVLRHAIIFGYSLCKHHWTCPKSQRRITMHVFALFMALALQQSDWIVTKDEDVLHAKTFDRIRLEGSI